MANYVIQKETFKEFADNHAKFLNEFYVRVSQTTRDKIPAENATFIIKNAKDENDIKSIFGEINIVKEEDINIRENDVVWLVIKYYEEEKIFKLVFELF